MADLRTIDEAAQRLRLKPRTVRRWIFLRKLSYVKVGASVRIPEAEIRRIIKEGTVLRLPQKMRLITGKMAAPSGDGSLFGDPAPDRSYRE
jgi:excisionase family DNA binding protein